MDWLSSQAVGLHVVGWLGFMLLVAFGSRLAMRTFLPADEHDDVQRVAAPLMPALGAAFGVLIGLTLASEAGYLKSAQDIVADEAAAASRLAWAATSPGVTGFGDRFTTMMRWLRSMIGRGRAEREFSVAHTGGDLSLPQSVRDVVQPVPFPSAPEVAEPVHP